jgi:hypothetical protein
MANHRFREQIEKLYGTGPLVEGPAQEAFVACPAVLIQCGCGAMTPMRLQIYQLAFQRAVATVRPSRWERVFGYSRN